MVLSWTNNARYCISLIHSYTALILLIFIVNWWSQVNIRSYFSTKVHYAFKLDHQIEASLGHTLLCFDQYLILMVAYVHTVLFK